MCVYLFTHTHAHTHAHTCRRDADNIAAAALLQGLPVPPETLHGGMTQFARQLAIQRFKEGKTDVLVATDVASRGLDVDEVDLVVHTNIPDEFDDYIHRSGRTGRAGRSGTSVLLHAPSKQETDRLGQFERACSFVFDAQRMTLSKVELATSVREYSEAKNAKVRV